MNVNYFISALKKYLRVLNAVINPRGYFIYSKKYYKNHQLSFSQEGEDLILSRIFDGQKDGFYVDVGAHHPQRFSNTYHFYLNGWRGINIDAMPGSMKTFNELRPEDINIEIPISDKSEELVYHQFNEPALNGFSEEISKQRNDHEQYKIIARKTIKTKKLSVVLNQYMPKSKVIDFMTVDVEGLDYEVLISNDWDEFRPKILVLEDLFINNWKDIEKSQIYIFLTERGYSLHSHLVRSFIYIDTRNQFI